MIQRRFNEGYPLVGFTLKVCQPNTNTIWIAFGRKARLVSIVPVVFDSRSRRICCGIAYTSCYLLEQALTDEERAKVHEQISTFCLLIPFKSQPFNHEYAVVHSDWDVLGCDGIKGESRLCTTLFEQDVFSSTIT